MSSSEDNYKFQLVEFTKSKEGVRDLDVVPSGWITWNAKANSLVVKYPPPPYTAKSFAILERIVKSEKTPLEEWPVWNIDVKGSADTYEIALQRLEKLKTAQYAYTTDSEQIPAEKANAVAAKLKKVSTEEMFKVPSLDDPPITKLSNSSGTSSETVTESTPVKMLKKIKQKALRKTNRLRQSSTSDDESLEEIIPKKGVTRPLEKKKFLKTVSKVTGRTPLKVVPQKTARKSPAKFPKNCGGVKTKASGITGFSPIKVHRESDAEIELPDAENFKSDIPKSGSDAKYTITSSDDLKNLKRSQNTPVKEPDEFHTYFNTKDGRIKVEGKYSPDTMLIVSVLKQFSIELRDNTDAINALTDALAANKPLSSKATVDRLQKTYELELPFETQEAFVRFDDKLHEEELKQNLILSLHQLLDRQHNVTKSITSIFRKFFDRDIIMGFTAMKRMPGKLLLRTTNFGVCMLAALKEFHVHPDGSAVNDDYILRCAGNSISNAKDWDGRRRSQKQ